MLKLVYVTLVWTERGKGWPKILHACHSYSYCIVIPLFGSVKIDDENEKVHFELLFASEIGVKRFKVYKF